MSADDLTPFEQPKPVEKTLCTACKVFTADCLVPMGDAALPACWECAHYMTEHEIAPRQAARARCECSPENIYPKAVYEERKKLREFNERHWKIRFKIPD